MYGDDRVKRCFVKDTMLVPIWVIPEYFRKLKHKILVHLRWSNSLQNLRTKDTKLTANIWVKKKFAMVKPYQYGATVAP